MPSTPRSPKRPAAAMDWSRLLAPIRLGRPEADATPDPLRTAFYKDWDRIVFSSAFRRLQDKTQVQPLAKTDYVRTRLTHSLEAASVGRSLGMIAGQAILEAEPGLAEVVRPQDVGAIVSAACLMHDVGNPPFGHAGEAAVQDYFADRGGRWLDGLTPAQREDLLAFEGNAQGFRIATRLQHPDQHGGLQLTRPTLGAFTKYPRGARAGKPARTGASGKKHGYMASEAPLFAELAQGLGLKAKGPGAWHRHPLAFLVEAADDICYGIVDIEDGVKSGHLALDELIALHEPFAGDSALARARALKDPQNRAEMLRAVSIGALVQRAAEAFVARRAALLDASFDTPLVDVMRDAGAFARFQHLARERLYNERSKAELQVAGFEIIADLLHTFCEAVDTVAARRRRGQAKAALVLRLLPRSAELVALKSPYLRLLGVTDFVAGMTDRYAVEMHRRLRGVDL